MRDHRPRRDCSADGLYRQGYLGRIPKRLTELTGPRRPARAACRYPPCTRRQVTIPRRDALRGGVAVRLCGRLEERLAEVAAARGNRKGWADPPAMPSERCPGPHGGKSTGPSHCRGVRTNAAGETKHGSCTRPRMLRCAPVVPTSPGSGVIRYRCASKRRAGLMGPARRSRTRRRTSQLSVSPSGAIFCSHKKISREQKLWHRSIRIASPRNQRLCSPITKTCRTTGPTTATRILDAAEPRLAAASQQR